MRCFSVFKIVILRVIITLRVRFLFMRRINFVVMVVLAAMVTGFGTSCSAPSQGDKEQLVNFYIGFAKEATSLDYVAIKEKYAVLAERDSNDGSENLAKSEVFAEFDTINPSFFSKLHLTDSSYSEVGSAYSSILLLSLATEGKGVEVTMPIDAVTTYQDEELGRTVYEIDRSKITATVPEYLASKVTRVVRKSLAPVRIVKEGQSWKVIADKEMLTEIGAPLSEEISAPTTTSK